MPKDPKTDAQKSSDAENAQLQTQPTDSPLNIIQIERVEEWHVTVEANSLVEWKRFCDDQGVTPLAIQLPDGRIQLMSAITDQETFDDFTAALTKHPEFTVVRIKHEVQALRPDEKPLYYEVHVKWDGAYRSELYGASRDLYRLIPQRWYLTRRGAPVAVPTDITRKDANGENEVVTVAVIHSPFSMEEIESQVINLQNPQRKLVGTEAEWVLTDTNPGLDSDWL